MKILFVTPYLPSPPGFGGQRRMHGLMGGLARDHEVSLISLVNPQADLDSSLRATREYCREVVVVENPPFALSLRGKRLLQLRSLASRRSFEWHSYVQPRLQSELRRLLARERWDVVNVEFAQMAPYRAGLGGKLGPGAPLFVLDEHNIEYEILRRTAEHEVGPVRRVFNQVNWRKLHAEELRAWRLFDGCTVTSANDEALLHEGRPKARTAVVPNAVDLDHFQHGSTAREPDTLLFFGAMNYFPNSDGLAFFLKEVFPLVLARRPSVKLRVVGHTPDHVWPLKSASVDIVGFVPDVRPYIERAAVAIVPLRVGGGTRLKILEAMAMGKAVVSTSLGAEGIEAQSGRDLLLADGPEAFAAAVVRVLEDPALADRLGAAARRLVEERYGWPAAVRKLEAFYQSLGGLGPKV